MTREWPLPPHPATVPPVQPEQGHPAVRLPAEPADRVYGDCPEPRDADSGEDDH